MHNPNPSVLLNSDAETVLFQKIFGRREIYDLEAVVSTALDASQILSVQAFSRRLDYDVDNTEDASRLIAAKTFGSSVFRPVIPEDSLQVLVMRSFGNRSEVVRPATEVSAGTMSAADKTKLDNYPSPFLLMGG